MRMTWRLACCPNAAVAIIPGTDHTDGTQGLMHQAGSGGAFSEKVDIIALPAVSHLRSYDAIPAVAGVHFAFDLARKIRIDPRLRWGDGLMAWRLNEP